MASPALFLILTLNSLPARQVIMFDPMYDSYVSMARRAGATIVPVRLQLPDFHVPLEVCAWFGVFRREGGGLADLWPGL